MKAEELSPKDLRIGNIVNYKYFNPHPENHECCFTKVVIRGVHESSIRISFPKQKHIEKVSKVYSIPLSEEVLLKCGFKCNKHGGIFSITEFPSVICIYKDGDTKWNDRYIDCKILYLHQLQNLYYALTGEELDVSL